MRTDERGGREPRLVGPPTTDPPDPVAALPEDPSAPTEISGTLDLDRDPAQLDRLAEK